MKMNFSVTEILLIMFLFNFFIIFFKLFFILPIAAEMEINIFSLKFNLYYSFCIVELFCNFQIPSQTVFVNTRIKMLD